MDSTGIIQVVLFIITVTAVAGFSGIIYLLTKIHQTLIRHLSGDATGVVDPQEEPGIGTQPACKPAVPLREIDPQNAGSLDECLGAISEKYGLASFTLATTDGLLVGATKPGAQDEAARYSLCYARGELQDETGAELLGIPHHGETVVGIACPTEPLSAELKSELEHDPRMPSSTEFRAARQGKAAKQQWVVAW